MGENTSPDTASLGHIHATRLRALEGLGSYGKVVSVEALESEPYGRVKFTAEFFSHQVGDRLL